MARLINITTYSGGKYKHERYGESVELKDNILVIGRETNGNFSLGLELRNPRVSNPHCYIFRYQDNFYLGDCISSFGTRYNRERVPNPLKSNEFLERLRSVPYERGRNDSSRHDKLITARKIVLRAVEDEEIRGWLVKESNLVKKLREGDIISIFLFDLMFRAK